MKNFLFYLAFLLQTTSTMATILVVDNNQYSPAPYTDVQTAINSAVSGDTILVKASATSYGNVIVNNKTVHIVGEGNKPHYDFPLNTTLGDVTFTNLAMVSNASNSSIEGCFINALYVGSTQPTNAVTNIVIRRCLCAYVIGVSASGSVLAYNNIIAHISILSSSLSCRFHNNLVTGTASLANNPTTTYSGSHVIKNNIFAQIGGNGYVHGSLGNSVVSDNIYYGASSPYKINDFNYCNFSHNISYGSVNDNFYTIGTNTGGNNQVGIDPMFVSQTNFIIDYTDDFHLLPTSPGKNTGSDGTDIGIYGGFYPWPDGTEASGASFMYTPEPQYPQVNTMTLQNAMIPSNGTIQIQVRAISNQ